jgi:hypothetical protein
MCRTAKCRAEKSYSAFEPVLLAFVLFGAPAGWTQQLKCPPAVTRLAVECGQIFPLPGAVFTLQDFAATMHQRGKTVAYCLVFFTDERPSQYTFHCSLRVLLFVGDHVDHDNLLQKGRPLIMRSRRLSS